MPVAVFIKLKCKEMLLFIREFFPTQQNPAILLKGHFQILISLGESFQIRERFLGGHLKNIMKVAQSNNT